MKRWCLLFSVLLFSYSVVANAHGPTRQKVTVKQMISAPPETVWDRVKDFHDMSWHPIIAKTEGDGGNTKGATRVLTLVNGGIINEELKKYDAGKQSFKYKINSVDVKILPVTNYSSTLTVKAAADGGSQVIWKGAFYRGYPNNDPPPELNDQAAKDAVTGVYKSGLENLKKLLEKGS
ncbi:MAG: SRPBCC family protein [Candidatus Thiodiazotropha taylori]|nr:SRPBCC family protein [Candidatus Thiodiazotropha taylori]